MYAWVNRQILRSLRTDWGWQFALGLGLSFFLQFAGGLAGAYDWAQFHSYNREYLLDSIGAGRLPFWNPYIYLGRPFLADVEVGVLYPTTYLHAFLSGSGALITSFFIHTLLSLRGIRALLLDVGVERRWIPSASLVWVTSGIFLARLFMGNIGYANGLAWLPWLFFYAERWARLGCGVDWLKLTAVIVAVFLSGNPQLFWSCALWLVVYTTGRSYRFDLSREFLGQFWVRVAGVFAAFFMAMALAAVQLLPFLSLILEGNRRPSLELAGFCPMRWSDLRSLIDVFARGNVPHEANLFVGVVFIGFAFGAVRYWREPVIRGLGLTAAVSVVISLGSATPFFGLLCEVVPGMTGFRLHSRTAVVVPLVVVVMASLVLTRSATESRVAVMRLVGFLLLLVFSGWVIFTGSSFIQYVLLFAASVGWGIVLLFPRVKYVSLMILLVVILEASLYFSACRKLYLDIANPLINSAELELVAELKPVDWLYPARVYLPSSLINFNEPMRQGISTPGGYAALASDRVWSYLHLAARVKASYTNNTFPESRTALAGLEVYKYAAINAMLNPMRDGLVFDFKSGARAWIADEIRPAKSYVEAILMGINDERPYSYAYSEVPMEIGRSSGSAGGAGGARGPVRWTGWSAERLELEWAPEKQGGFLILSEAWYPGWEAQVNGQDRLVFPVNGWMRCVRVEPGDSRVVFTYKPPRLTEGILLSGLAWLGWFYLFIRARREQAAERAC